MNAMWIQLIVKDEDMEVITDALMEIMDDERVMAGCVDARKLHDCPTCLYPLAKNSH